MCGRYANFLAEQDLIDAFEIASVADDARLAPHFNIGPTQTVQIVRPARVAKGEPAVPDAGRELAAARWGLVPAWAKDVGIGVKMFNARIETIADKPAFRTAFAQRRCIVPASGYYEWHTDHDGKRPFYIHPQDGGALAFAGLFEFWKDRSVADAPWVVSCSIVTTAARGEMQDIHDRQPVMLTPENWEVWLERESTPYDLFAAAADPAPALAWHEVSKAVGNIRVDEPGLVEPV
jgi:putative SOS response-associated peptidase YedK